MPPLKLLLLIQVFPAVKDGAPSAVNKAELDAALTPVPPEVIGNGDWSVKEAADAAPAMMTVPPAETVILVVALVPNISGIAVEV